MRKIVWLLLLLPFALQAQFRFNGIVKDVSTKKALPFATVTVGSNSIVSDIDGKFSIETTTQTSTLKASYIGFAKAEIPINNQQSFYTILLVPEMGNLSEVNVSNKNPTLEIIRKTILYKNVNNPEKQLSSFEFKAYNKLIITANPDSIKGSIDSVFVRRKGIQKLKKIDSSDYKFKKTIRKQHLFQTEKVSEYEFADQTLKETVLATKMAGFKQPIYEIMAFNLQSFSIYDNRYELLETKYNSPISDDSSGDYHFKLLDSTTIENRKVYMIYFKNRLKRKAAGLEGMLYIDSENFGVAKAIMRVKGVLDISGTHEFTYLKDEKLWFPTNKNFKIVKGKNNEDIHFLGETLKFDADENNQAVPRQRFASDYTYVLSETNFFDIHYNNPIKVRNPHIFIEVKDDAENKPESFWNKFRKDSLDIRSRKTYFALDSIVGKERIETRLLQGRKLLNGYVPFGPVDLALRSLLSYNNYEGFRVGIGGRTNEKFSRKYRIEGYTAYGTKDGNFKYNLGFSSRIGKFSSSWIGISYTDDLKEIASTSFAIDRKGFKLYDPRPINLSTFYGYQSWKLFLETKIIPKTESIWQLEYATVEPKFNYIYNYENQLYQSYTMTTAQAALQWNPFSDYMQTPYGRLEAKKRFPRFTFQFTQALPKVLDNDFVFSKFDFRTEYEKNFMNGQKTSILFQSGYAYGDVPLSHLYNISPNNLNRDRLLQRLTIGGRNSFETMFFNEFFSSKYAFLQLKHAFQRIELFKNVKPLPVFVTRIAFGDLKKPEQHAGINYKTLENGYYESGFEINQIYSVLGLSAFYRYGANQLPRLEDNIAIKLTFVLNLGF